MRTNNKGIKQWQFNLIGLGNRHKRTRLLVGLANIKHFPPSKELSCTSVFSNTIAQWNNALPILGFSSAVKERGLVFTFLTSG